MAMRMFESRRRTNVGVIKLDNKRRGQVLTIGQSPESVEPDIQLCRWSGAGVGVGMLRGAGDVQISKFQISIFYF